MKKNTINSDEFGSSIDKAMNPEKEALLSELNRLRIDPLEDIPPPPIALKIINKENGEERIIGTLGNFSVLTGKAKSRKSFLVNLMVSASCREYAKGILIGNLPAHKKIVLYFDTEQGKYHVQLALKRICKQLGISNPENLFVFCLRGKSPKERVDLINSAIEYYNEAGLVVIDGIKDLITSINDEEQASMVVSKLLKWSEEKNIHIMVVLHQNKGDNNARGHIGTEIVNKAETVLSVSKHADDLEISIVEPKECRNKEPDSFAFKIEGDIPKILEDFEFKKNVKKTIRIETMQHHEIYQIFEKVFNSSNIFTYQQLIPEVKQAFRALFGQSIGDNKSKELIKIAKANDWLIQEKDKGPYTLGVYINDKTKDSNNKLV